jgi:hypothetical protein
MKKFNHDKTTVRWLKPKVSETFGFWNLRFSDVTQRKEEKSGFCTKNSVIFFLKQITIPELWIKFSS